ncbi:MAG TPA: CinA family nicotinamide mononucleotide deamidase-related protein [Thermoanaerobaculia bacterium]|nr:CinA family nicotinamide mononucleotide deamidase-related protein [Thermoanaerobaculia bacterium]
MGRAIMPGMRAAILAVGSELLGTERLDTNSLRLTAAFDRHGVELRRKAVVGDAEDEIAADLRSALPRVEVVVVTGGLGPTADDVTRQAVAAALGRSLSLDAEVLAGIERRFARLGWRMPEVNRRQAEVISGAEVLANARGTAPGMRLEAGKATLFLFPGVPAELEGMIETHLEPWLAARSGGASRETAVLKVAGLPESLVEERIAPAYDEFGRESITILSKPGEILLQATAAGTTEERRARLAAMTARLSALVGDAVYAARAEDSLESVVGDLLRAAGATVAVAESCTGGLLGERLSRIPGSSDYFVGGAITYSDRLKRQLLGVPAALLAEHGAVSEPVARAMAAGALAAFGSDYAVAITGVAGPGGGSAAKPVGTVHLAVAGPPLAGRDAATGGRGAADTASAASERAEGRRDAEPRGGGAAGSTGERTGAGGVAEEAGGGIQHRRVRLPGDRERIRWQASQLALELLRRRLLASAAAAAGSADPGEAGPPEALPTRVKAEAEAG